MTFPATALIAALAVSLPLPAQTASAPLTEREKMLLDRLAAMEARLSALEKRLEATSPAAPAVQAAAFTPSASATPLQPEPTIESANSWLKDTTLNFYFDGYYSWSNNHPLGRINLLRAFDVLSNSFTINQTGMVIEKAAASAPGKRWGYRLDLMYGQSTETLQGGTQNEPRPQVYRNIFQAYGTYIIPVGHGLTTDFGKWASALGAEGNYTKDQINYSRSYFFNFLPFYHTGFRTTYPVNDKLSLTYWLVNGGNQAEDFNEFKSQLGQVVYKPSKALTWTLNYYNGQDQRDLVPLLNPGLPALPTQPGLSTTPVIPIPNGRFHVIDTYAFLNPGDKLTLGGELVYAINRVESNSPPQRVNGGAAYFRYRFTPKFYFGQRYARLNDTAGLFSGVVQNLNDLTSTVGFSPSPGFETRFEYRRDFSDVPFFLKSNPGALSSHQDTLTLGLLWWFGGKSGGW